MSFVFVLLMKTTGKADRDRNEFKKFLKTIWFGLYSRAAGKQGSSGFEHVFLGERKNGISGLHNWLRYRAEEVKGTMNYLGFIRTVSLGKVKCNLLQFRF